MQRLMCKGVPGVALLLWSDFILAAGALEGASGRQAVNPIAIGMFLLFVAFTLVGLKVDKNQFHVL